MIRQALWILRKDIRRMRPRIAVVWLLMAAAAVVDASVGRHPELTNMRIFLFPVVLAEWFLVISVVQEDRLAGDRQFWITRPYSWKSLLLAKVLFVLLLLDLPELLDHIVALSANGLSPLHYLPALLWGQAGLAVGMLFAIATGALTSSIAQVVLAALIGCLALLLGSMFAARAGAQGALGFGSAEPVETACHWAIATVLAGLACWRQFSQRDAMRASGLLVGGLVLALPFYGIVPWGAAFHLVAMRLPTVDSTAVHLGTDAARKASGGSFHMEDGKLAVRLPLRVTAIPDGMEVYSERIKVALQAPDGAVWNSGWDAFNEIQDQALLTQAVDRRLPGKGEPYWLNVNIGASFYREHGDEPVDVHATVAFTMLGRAQTTVVADWGGPHAIAGNTVCNISKRETMVSAICVSPLRKPALTAIRFEPVPSGYENRYASLDHPPAGSNDLGEFGIWRVSQNVTMTPPPEPFAMSVEVRQAVAHFERELDMPAVRLKELREP